MNKRKSWIYMYILAFAVFIFSSTLLFSFLSVVCLSCIVILVFFSFFFLLILSSQTESLQWCVGDVTFFNLPFFFFVSVVYLFFRTPFLVLYFFLLLSNFLLHFLPIMTCGWFRFLKFPVSFFFSQSCTASSAFYFHVLLSSFSPFLGFSSTSFL